jgi:hypothetical protein
MDKPNDPSPTLPVLVTIAVIVEAPTDNEARFWRIQAVADKLRQAAEQVCAADPGCTPTGVSSVHYLGDESENAIRCTRCTRWATDVDQSDWIDGIDCGSFIDGRFLCEQCRVAMI